MGDGVWNVGGVEEQAGAGTGRNRVGDIEGAVDEGDGGKVMANGGGCVAAWRSQSEKAAITGGSGERHAVQSPPAAVAPEREAAKAAKRENMRR